MTLAERYRDEGTAMRSRSTPIDHRLWSSATKKQAEAGPGGGGGIMVAIDSEKGVQITPPQKPRH